MEITIHELKEILKEEKIVLIDKEFAKDLDEELEIKPEWLFKKMLQHVRKNG